jgi:hypothetical protein
MFETTLLLTPQFASPTIGDKKKTLAIAITFKEVHKIAHFHNKQRLSARHSEQRHTIDFQKAKVKVKLEQAENGN